MKRNSITIKHITDHNRQHISIVPLADQQDAILYDSDLAFLLFDLGLSPFWKYHDTMGVTCYLSKWKRYGSVARILIGAMPGTSITFRDGNKLNLRSDNIIVTDKRTGRADSLARDGIRSKDYRTKIEHVFI